MAKVNMQEYSQDVPPLLIKRNASLMCARATADAFMGSLSKDTEVHASPPELEGLRDSANLRAEAP